jgi:hypothetical protein
VTGYLQIRQLPCRDAQHQSPANSTDGGSGASLSLDKGSGHPIGCNDPARERTEGMPRLTQKLAEEIILKEVQNLDKRVQIVAVNQTKKKDAFRITLLKDGKSGTSKINKDILKKYVDQEGKDSGLRKALGKAVGHLSIHYGR